MKIKMLSTQVDEEFNSVIWNEGDIYEVKDDDCCDYYIVKVINDIPYGVSKYSNGQNFEIIE